MNFEITINEEHFNNSTLDSLYNDIFNRFIEDIDIDIDDNKDKDKYIPKEYDRYIGKKYMGFIVKIKFDSSLTIFNIHDITAYIVKHLVKNFYKKKIKMSVINDGSKFIDPIIYLKNYEEKKNKITNKITVDFYKKSLNYIYTQILDKILDIHYDEPSEKIEIFFNDKKIIIDKCCLINGYGSQIKDLIKREIDLYKKEIS